MANNDKENKIKKFTKEAIGKTLNEFNKEIGITDLVEVNKNQDRILNGILSQVNDENTEKTEKSNVIMLDNSTDGIVELQEIQGDTNVNVSKIAEETPITHIIEDKEGSVISLDDITEGAINIDNIQGNTMVNCNKEANKELILMEDLSTEGYSNITLNKSVDGGKVDVALEGNTMVNVCNQKDPVAITKSYTVQTGNHVALQGEYDGKCRPVVTGNTLWIDNDTEDVLTAFDEAKNLRLQSSFEDKVVTQEMVDNGEELAENLGKYKVDYVISKEDGTVGFTKTFYLNSPLLEEDTIEQQGNNVVHVHRYGKVVLDGSANTIWELQNTKANTIAFFTYNIPNKANNNMNIICDKFITVSDKNSMDTYDFDCVRNASGFYINISKSKLSTQDVAGFRQWLQQNPTTVVYQLATPQYEVISQNDTILCDSYVNGHLDVDSAVPINRVGFMPTQLSPLKYVYEKTKYTLQFESDNVGKIDYLMIGQKTETNIDVIKGLNKINITTVSTSPYIDFRGIGFNASNIVVTQAIEQDFGYFEGMKSVGECEDLEVVSSNKNLFDIQSVANRHSSGITIIDNGIQVDNGLYSLKDVINIDPNKQYTISWNCEKISGEGTSGLEVVYTDGNTNYRVGEGNQIFTSDKGRTIDFIRITYSNNGVVNLTNIQLEEGDTATDYIPHASNTQTLTHEPLRAVGDIKDKYVLIDGKWYIERNCLEKTINELYNSARNKQLNQNDTCNDIRLFTDNLGIKGGKNPQLYSDFKYANRTGVIGEAVVVTGQGTDTFIFHISKEINSKDRFLEVYGNGKCIFQLKTPQYEPIDYNPFEVYSDITHISNNSTIPCNMTIKNTGYNCLLKPSTTYTVSSNLGLNTVTTPSTLTEDCLRFYDTDTSTVTTMKDVMVLEGDYTTNGKPLPSHFSGIESAFEQEYDEAVGKYKVRAKVVGKNLFDGELELGTISGETGLNVAYYQELRSKNYIRIPCLPFTISISPNARSYIGLRYYDKNYKYLGSSNGVQHGSVIGVSPYIPPIGTYYIRFKYISTDLSIRFQIEQGTQATPYEPYKENYIGFYIDEPLRGIGNTKDKVYVKDDKVVVERNCGSVTLDGVRVDRILARNQVAYSSFLIRVPGMKASLGKNKTASYNDKFKTLTVNEACTTSILNSEYIYHNDSSSPQLVISVLSSKLQTQDVVGFKKWLQQNPTTVVYERAEPVYEEADYQEQRLFLNTYNNSTLFYESNIPVSNTSFKPLWEELVYLKNSTKYYIQFNSTASGTVVINLGGTELTTEIVEGYNYIPITTPSESTNLMTISGQGITISEVVVSEVVCGGYYKGLQSCFEEHMENGKYRVLLRGIALDGSKVNGIKLYINEPLRGVEDTKDRLCIKNGKLMVERKCSEAIFDGSDDEKWVKPSTQNTNTTRFLWVEYPGNSALKINNCICNKLNTKSNAFSDEVGTWIDNNTIISTDSSITTVDEFKQWLQQNPVKIVYQLKEPTYEEATNEYGLPIVFEGYENGIVYIDSAVTPTTHIKYTSNNQLATTLSEAEEQNITTQEDINMNVITYMMDIDMMLTDMEMSNDISVMAVRRDSSNENMLDRMSDEDKKVYRDNTVVMLEKMITANVLDKEDIERRINMYYNKNRISKEQYKYLKSLL